VVVALPPSSTSSSKEVATVRIVMVHSTVYGSRCGGIGTTPGLRYFPLSGGVIKNRQSTDRNHHSDWNAMIEQLKKYIGKSCALCPINLAVESNGDMAVQMFRSGCEQATRPKNDPHRTIDQ
jgi:hypothetical protein